MQACQALRFSSPTTPLFHRRATQKTPCPCRHSIVAALRPLKGRTPSWLNHIALHREVYRYHVVSIVGPQEMPPKDFPFLRPRHP